MSAAIHFEGDAYLIPKEKPMGRNYAGHGFLNAFAQHATSERVTGFVRDSSSGTLFTSMIAKMSPGRAADYITLAKPDKLKSVGCLYTPSIINPSQAWLRNAHGARSWSLCGVNHTLSSNRAMEGVAALLTLPIRPWDAMICTSQASKAVIERLLERQSAYLRDHLGATQVNWPQLPVIPLGVDSQAQQKRAARREEARAELGIGEKDVVVLFLGRLTFHAKANPAPMYMALERLAKRHSFVLIECGWAANGSIAAAFSDAKAKLCPSVRTITLDGRKDESRDQAWAAADIFCSLTDNIQETFGLTPIEAMAAGLPVIVTDWDGYKDTVRDGIDGFTVPTIFAPLGAGIEPALRHALELDSYDGYIGHVSTATVVDLEATTAAFDRLAADPELRRRMGMNGAARAREVFDWRVVVEAYERVWAELGELRRSGREPRASPLGVLEVWPARPDPFDLFASFPTAVLSSAHALRQAPGIEAQEVNERLGLHMAMLSLFRELSAEDLLDLWKRVGPAPATVKDLMAREATLKPAVLVRALLLLAKFDLLRIQAPDS